MLTMSKTLFVPDHVKRGIEKERLAEKSTSNPLDPSTFGLPKEEDNKSALERLPKPTGWRILILPYTIPKEKNGIIYADETIERSNLATNTGYVVSLGPDAYKDENKFPDGAWCKKGDWVLFGRYAGSRFKIQGSEPRLLNDDEVLAVITDPRDILNV